jgi:integrase
MAGRPPAPPGPLGQGWLLIEPKKGYTRVAATWNVRYYEDGVPKDRRGGTVELGTDKTIRVKRGQTLRQAAQAIWDEIRPREWAAAGSAGVGITSTVQDFIDKVFIPVWSPGRWLDPGTREHWLYVMSRWGQEILRSPIGRVTAAELQAQITKASGELSRSVVVRMLGQMREVYRMAMSDQVVHKDPTTYLRVPPASARKKQPALPAEFVARFINNVPAGPMMKRDQLIIRVLAETGMRKAELFALQRKSVDGVRIVVSQQFRHGKLKAPKANSGRECCVSLGLAADLESYAAFLGLGADDWMWPSSRGTPINASNFLNRMLRPLAKSVGWAGPVNYHMFRRGWATEAHSAGAATAVIASQLGHIPGSPVTERHYIQSIGADQLQVAELVAGRFKRKAGD